MKKFFLLTFLCLLGLHAFSSFRYLKGTLQGSQEVPPNPSSGGGIVIIKYNTTTKFLELWANYIGLSGAPTSAHIHSGAAGVNGPVIITLSFSGTAGVGTLSGSGTLTAGQETDLLAGNMYVNVHTATYAGGEVRAQLSTTTLSQTVHLNGRLQGAQEAPPNPSTGTGWVNALVDKTTNQVFITGYYTGLSSAASSSHLHIAEVLTNGPVAVTLTHNPATFGTIHGQMTLSPAEIADIAEDGSYINIHNATYPSGELRAQLTTFSQQKYFWANLQGSQEVPPNPSAGKGIVLVKYDMETRLLELTGDFHGLASAATAAHIHSGMFGTNGPAEVTLNHTTGTVGTLNVSTTLSTGQATNLLNGDMYVNVHNATYPDGELRGQLNEVVGSLSQVLYAFLQGPQEVPASGSSGTGYAIVLLDLMTNKVYCTGNFSGLGSSATMAHIHHAPAGTNGPAILTLNVGGTTSGTFNGLGTLNSTQAQAMKDGFTYINLHTSSIPAGEIRGQLGNIVLPVKLNFFNGVRKGDKVELTWEIKEEVNLSKYEIEQQNNSTGSWSYKASIIAGGFSRTHRYSHLDKPILNTGSTLHYRLKMIDKDGRISYSPIIKINFRHSKPEVMLLSNPALNDELRFTLTGIGENQHMDVYILDMNGRKILQTTGKAFGFNNIDISKLAPGMYQLSIRSGNEVINKAFIK